AGLTDELDVDAGAGVRALEVEDQLLEILDRVDVVVRRRGDESDARRAAAGAGDPGVDLCGRELAALPRLGALGELDLDVVGLGEVHARHTEPPRGDLLDRAAALRVQEPVDILSPFAGVRLAADPVHGDGEGLVRL